MNLASVHVLRRFVLAFFIFLTVGNARKLGGQSPEEIIARRVRVTVAVKDELPNQARGALIYRNAMNTVGDVILVRSGDLDSRLLEEALIKLLVMRAIQGDTARMSSTVRVDPVGAGALPRWHGRERGRVTSAANRLRHATAVEIPGFGNLPGILLYLQPHPLAGRLRTDKRPAGD